MSRKVAESWWNRSAEIMGNPPVIIPPEVAYYKLYPPCGLENAKKIPVTWSEVMEERKKNNNSRLLYKRSVRELEKPALLNVFYCPAWLFERWWICVKTVDREYPVNFKTLNARELERQCFHIFPLGIIGEFDYVAWCEEFYKRYKVPARNFKGQKIAFARVRVRIKCGNIIEIMKYMCIPTTPYQDIYRLSLSIGMMLMLLSYYDKNESRKNNTLTAALSAIRAFEIMKLTAWMCL